MRARTTRWRMIMVGLATAGLLAGVGVAPAAAATGAESSDWPCGFFTYGSSSWYNHCTGDGTAIEIRMDYVAAPDKNRCVGAGPTRLGFDWQIRNAWYTGKLC